MWRLQCDVRVIVSITLVLVMLLLAFQTAVAKSAVVGPPGQTKAAATRALSQAEWDALVKKAQKEGRVVVYGAGIGDTTSHLKKAFHDRYGIDLEFLSGRGNDMIQKVLSERRAGLYSADIGNGGITTWLTIIKPANITVPLEPLLVLDEVRDPTKWRSGKMPFYDKEKRVVTLAAVRQRYVCINTTMVKPNDIASFNDLLDPKWKGKIVLNDPSVTGHGNNWFSYMMIRLLGREKGAEYMKKLIANQPTLVRDERLQVEWAAKGKYPIMVGGKQTVVESFIKAGAPLKWDSVKEPVPLSSGSLNLLAFQNAPHPNAQKLFVNWILGREAGEIIAKTSGFPSERTDVDHTGFDSSLIPKPNDILEGEEYEFQKAKMPKVAEEMFKDILK